MACSGSNEVTENGPPPDEDPKGSIYVHEQGQVELIQINDTLWRTIFINNNGHEFDTTMVDITDDTAGFFRPAMPDEKLFLRYSWGGLSISETKIKVLEFASYGRLGTEAMMPKIYERPFFKNGSKINLGGDVVTTKGGTTCGGYHINDLDHPKSGFWLVEGTIRKEAYPIDYYSTDDSPQGMFGDTSKKHYRMVLEDCEFTMPSASQYIGYPVNLSTGEAALAWQFADSEAYILEGHEPWTDEELGTEIQVMGYLLQDHTGSFLKNWVIED